MAKGDRGDPGSGPFQHLTLQQPAVDTSCTNAQLPSRPLLCDGMVVSTDTPGSTQIR